MTDEPDRIPAADLPSGAVRRVGDWAVGNRGGAYFAVSRRCRHQLADLAEGEIDAEGCLVCPWHQSRYDVRTGEMVSGPKGRIFGFGPYSKTVQATANTVAKLRRFDVELRDGAIWLRSST